MLGIWFLAVTALLFLPPLPLKTSQTRVCKCSQWGWSNFSKCNSDSWSVRKFLADLYDKLMPWQRKNPAPQTLHLRTPKPSHSYPKEEIATFKGNIPACTFKTSFLTLTLTCPSPIHLQHKRRAPIILDPTTYWHVTPPPKKKFA